MKLSFPVTKEKIRTHFSYAWWQYVLLVCLAIFGWNLLYTTTRYRSPNHLRLECYFGGYQAEGTKDVDALMDELHQSLFPEMEEVSFHFLTLDETYGSMQLMVWISAGEGDLFMLPGEDFQNTAQGEAFAELTPYIESGALNAEGLDLSKGYVINRETGKKALYGVPAAELPGLGDYGLYLDDLYLSVSVTGENEAEAVRLLNWLMENMRREE